MPGESHGQRSLVGYSPWGRKESDMTELQAMQEKKALSSRGRGRLRGFLELLRRAEQGTSLVKVLVAQSCLTLWDPVDCSPPDSSAHGILQARMQEWVAIPFSRGSSQPRDRTCQFRKPRPFPSPYHLPWTGRYQPLALCSPDPRPELLTYTHRDLHTHIALEKACID